MAARTRDMTVDANNDAGTNGKADPSDGPDRTVEVPAAVRAEGSASAIRGARCCAGST